MSAGLTGSHFEQERNVSAGSVLFRLFLCVSADSFLDCRPSEVEGGLKILDILRLCTSGPLFHYSFDVSCLLRSWILIKPNGYGPYVTIFIIGGRNPNCNKSLVHASGTFAHFPRPTSLLAPVPIIPTSCPNFPFGIGNRLIINYRRVLILKAQFSYVPGRNSILPSFFYDLIILEDPDENRRRLICT